MKTWYINNQNGPNFTFPPGLTLDAVMFGDTRFGPRSPSDIAYTNIVMGIDPAGRGYPTDKAYKFEAAKYTQCQDAIVARGTQFQGQLYDRNRVLYDPAHPAFREFMATEADRLAPWGWIMFDNITPKPISSGTFTPTDPKYTDLVYYESLMTAVSEFISALRKRGSKARVLLNISKPWTVPQLTTNWPTAIEFLMAHWTLLGVSGFVFEYPNGSDCYATAAWTRLGLRTIDDQRPLFLIVKSNTTGNDRTKTMMVQLDSPNTYLFVEP